MLCHSAHYNYAECRVVDFCYGDSHYAECHYIFKCPGTVSFMRVAAASRNGKTHSLKYLPLQGRRILPFPLVFPPNSSTASRRGNSIRARDRQIREPAASSPSCRRSSSAGSCPAPASSTSRRSSSPSSRRGQEEP
jgi:hypothetical protein